MSEDIYLTDKQYVEILYKIKEIVNRSDFKPFCRDCTEIGNKFTVSNCGFCNENFTTKETALFPDEFPARKSMKYRRKNQICPFDQRIFNMKKDGFYDIGCYYHCYLFKTEEPNIDKMKKMVNMALKIADTTAVESGKIVQS